MWDHRPTTNGIDNGLCYEYVVGVSNPEPMQPQMGDALSDWVPVLVRLADYAAVTQFIAAREGERANQLTATSTHNTLADSGMDPRLSSAPAWPEDALRRLAASTSLTAQRWTRAMDAIAVGTEEWYSTSEVAQMSGLTVNEWRDAPRKITRHLKAHYQDVPVHDGSIAWPLRAWSNPDKPGEVSWGMPPVTRERWRKIRQLEQLKHSVATRAGSTG